MRFIDVRSLVEFLTKLEEAGEEHISFGDLKKFIYEQCASYDVDKVVEQLKENSFVPGDRIGVSDTKIIMSEKAVKIVKSGGVGNSD